MKRVIGARHLTRAFLAGTGLGLVFSIPVQAQITPAPQNRLPSQTTRPGTDTVVITGDTYQRDNLSLSKSTRPILDTPQSIQSLSQQLLEDRGVTNLNDALRNVPGISLGAGEFSWQGNNPSIRGFVARNDMFLDGMRDFGSYYRDAFNFEAVEVLKGPSSVFFGRGSTGGVINQVSKTAKGSDTATATVSAGSNGFVRGVVDMDLPLTNLLDDAAVRLTVMSNESDAPGRDVAEVKRMGAASSLALGLGTPTRLTASYLHQQSDDIPDYGHPWYFGQLPPVSRSNFYGFTDDYLHTNVNIATLKVEHDLAPGITLRNQLRYSKYWRDFRISEPVMAAGQTVATPLATARVARNIWAGESVEDVWMNQLDAKANFTTGGLTHDMVAGVEASREFSKPLFENFSGIATVSLLNPDPSIPLTGNRFPRVFTDTTAKTFGAYFVDTIKLAEQWEFTGGLRWDRFESDYKGITYSTTAPGAVTATTRIPRVDKAFSYRAALVYKPVTNASIYMSYGTSFNPSAEGLSQITSGRAFGVQNAFLAPEKNVTYELGGKWDLLDGRATATAAVFRLEKDNARVPDPANPGFNMLAGMQRVDGFEINIGGLVTDDLRVTAGYAYLDGKIVKSAAGAAPVGSPLINTPENTFTFWMDYRVFPGLEFGLGGQYVSERYAQNTGVIEIAPGYFTLDAMAKYKVTEKLGLQLNVNNLTDKFYYDQLHGFHIVPGAGRSYVLALNFTL